MEKLKFGFYWAASCGGCEIAVLDVDEKILDLLQIADVVFWPVAMDVKYKDVEEMVDGYMDVCFFNGGIRNSEQEHLAKLLRRKAKYMVAFGACAQLGGVPGLANLSTKREILDRSYHTTESTDNKAGTEPQPKHKLPEGESEIPVLSESVKPLDRIILVDYYLPGCPPPPKLIFNAIDAITKGQLPPQGSILAPELAVCDECPRKKNEKKVSSIKRIIDFTPDLETCLLEQGLVCMGPATRGGCDAKCLGANMPCTGCGGACPGAIEQGSAMISALSTVLGITDEKAEEYDVDMVMAQLKDPVGTFYKYTLPASIIDRSVKK